MKKKKSLEVQAQGKILTFLVFIGVYLDMEVRTLALQTWRLADKHTFLLIVTLVLRRCEKPTEKVLAQSEETRYGTWKPIYLPS